MSDMLKIRRETIRWQILLTLNTSRPLGASENMVLSVVRTEFGDATQEEIRREMGYLQERNLIKIDKKPSGQWKGELTRYGIDVVEYTVDVEPGIARPEKYFDA